MFVLGGSKLGIPPLQTYTLINIENDQFTKDQTHTWVPLQTWRTSTIKLTKSMVQSQTFWTIQIISHKETLSYK